MTNKWRYSIFFVIGLMFIAMIASGIMQLSVDPSYVGNVMLINIEGPIMSYSADTGIFGSDVVSSSFVVKSLMEAQKDPNILAVVLSIDSPGGGAVASQEIVEALKSIDKPSIAVIRSLGASGAYWVASATDKIYSNPLSLIGSIGVTSSYLEFSGLLERYNITYERLVSAEHKDIGSPLRSLTDEERTMLMRQINLVHDFFVEDVASNRGVDKSVIQELATGNIYMGSEAVRNGLVDELGNINLVKEHLEEDLNTTIVFRQVRRRSSIFDIMTVFGNNFAFNFGKGFASWMTQERQQEIISLR